MLGVTRYLCNALRSIITFVVTNIISNITKKYAIKTGNIMRVTLLTNLMRYLSNNIT